MEITEVKVTLAESSVRVVVVEDAGISVVAFVGLEVLEDNLTLVGSSERVLKVIVIFSGSSKRGVDGAGDPLSWALIAAITSSMISISFSASLICSFVKITFV